MGGSKVKTRRQGEVMSGIMCGYHGEPVQLRVITQAPKLLHTPKGFRYTGTNEVMQTKLENGHSIVD